MLADFMWHSHMQDNAAYKEDMTKTLGKVLNHNDCEQNYVQFLYDCKVKDIVGVIMHHWNEFEHKKQEEGQPQQQ